MGIAIAYSGRLSDPGCIAALIDDLTAKARSAGWLYKTMPELLAEGRVTCAGLEGITLYPHRECEHLQFHFDREGTFTNHTYYTLLTDPEKANMMRQALAESGALMRTLTPAPREEAPRGGPAQGSAGAQYIRVDVADLPEAPGMDFFKGGSRYNWTKTQFAGPKVHVAVCAILRYVKQRYAPDLEIRDDSGYFIDGDYAKLEAQLAYVDRMVSLTSQAIEAVAASGTAPMSLDAFVERINEELAAADSKLH